MRGRIVFGLLSFVFGTVGYSLPGYGASDGALRDQVTAVFTQRCAVCHGPAGVRKYDEAKGKFDYVLDLDRLATAGKLISPGNPQDSKLFTMVSRNQMPDGADTFAEDPVPEEEKAIIQAWIASLDQSQGSQRALITDQFILDSIAADLAAMPGPRQFQARSVTLTPLYNAGEPQDRPEVYRQGVAKLFISLTWQSTPVITKAIDP